MTTCNESIATAACTGDRSDTKSISEGIRANECDSQNSIQSINYLALDSNIRVSRSGGSFLVVQFKARISSID